MLVLVMNEITVWNTVVGASMPRPRGFSGIRGWSDSTI